MDFEFFNLFVIFMLVALSVRVESMHKRLKYMETILMDIDDTLNRRHD